MYRDCVTGRRGPFPAASFRSAHNLHYVKLLCLRKFESECFVAREPEAAGNFVLPSGAYALQARQEARDFRRDVRESVPCG